MGKLYVGGRLFTELESIPNPTDSSIPTGLDVFPEKFCKNKCVDRDELFVNLDVSGLAELDELFKKFDEERSAKIFEPDESPEYFGVHGFVETDCLLSKTEFISLSDE
ncbi:hypothetical protein AGMMS49936_07710 [Endomicrobiia bacterium]|nr:hypothetical protein AGMMS49936_07710 [Endomicrobiia bacterium]